VARGLDCALFALSVVALGASLAWSVGPADDSSQLAGARYTSDVDGELQAVLIHHDPRADAIVGPVYSQLLAAFPPEVTVYVATPDPQATLEALGALRPVVPIRVGGPITTWSRDRYALTSLPDGGFGIVVPTTPFAPDPARANDALVPWAVAHELGLPIGRAELRFEGGDLIGTSHRLFADANLLARNPTWTREQVVTWLEERFGLPVTLLGDEHGSVPDHHIGMYLTPLRDGHTVLVGDPELAWKHLVAKLGQAEAQRVIDELEGDLSPERVARFSRVREQLQAEGFEVISMPLIPCPGRSFVTYNNGVAEVRAGQDRFYTPVYDVPALDQLADEQLAQLGIECVPIDVSGIYRFNGSVRCLVHVVSR
jgi:hypothetical protein